MNLRQILNNSKIGLLDKVNLVKTQIKPSEYYKTFKNNRILNQVLNRNLFPEKLDNIKINDAYHFTNDFISEFQWVATKILDNITEINQFTILKEKFEISLLKNEYENARNIFENITTTLGHSLWSIESELHIAEEEIGSSENWQKLSNYLKTTQNPFYEFCINASSKKIENSISFESYVNQVQNDIDTINADIKVKDFFVFNNFKLASYDYDFSDLSSVIYISNLFSLIDQYNNLIDVIIFNLNKKDTQYYTLFKSFISELVIEGNIDSRVININNYLSQDNFIENKNWLTLNKILESYYDGNFESALELSRKFISNYPLEFEIYEIYVKSLINMDKGFVTINIKSIDSILYELYNFLQFKKENERHGLKLIKYALKYSNSILGFQIMDFLSNVDNDKIYSLKYSFYSNTYKIATQKIENNFSIKFEQYFSKYNYYTYKKVLYGIKTSEYEKFKTKDELLKINLDLTHLYNNEDYSNVIRIIKDRYAICTSINYYKERFIYFLFNAYLKENNITGALTLFGTLIFDETTFYIKINFRELFDITFNEEEKFKHIENINALILGSLYRSEYNLYEILDDFLCSQDCDIKEILHLKDLKKESFIYLLYRICTIDTIKYYFRCVSDAEEFRLKILFHLITIDEVNKESYCNEIDEINKKISVRNVIKEVNNGRLFVDIDKLKEQLVDKYNDDFNRLLRIVGEKENNTLVGFNASKPRKWEASLKEQIKEDSNNYNEADFLAFKNIYFDVREQFLFSKEYGLDSSLSTRIRHGALENQIRSVFENLNLVTTKLAGEYIDSEYWNSQNLDPTNLQLIQKQIKLFSKSVDDFTSGLKNSVIQISHERINKVDALFDYSINDETIYAFYNKLNLKYVNDTSDIIEILLNLLSQLTNSNTFANISVYLNKVVYEVIDTFIQDFIHNLPEYLPKKILLVENLNKSLTNLQSCLGYITEWFILETSSSSTLLPLDDVIQASIETTKQLNRNINIETSLINDFKEIECHYSMIYVFNILFTNAIIHSEIENKISINIKVDLIEENFIRINITNNHTLKNVSDKIDSLETTKANWNNRHNIERANVEGESGFHKIKRIMIYEAKCITDKFDYKLTDKSATVSLFLIYNKPTNNEITNNRR